jgi:hypothetical protein
MRVLNAIVCAAAFIGFGTAPTFAQQIDLHPTLQKQPPRIVLNKDITALAHGEQTEWIHGAVAQMVQVYAGTNHDVAQCLSAWAFDKGNGLQTTAQYVEAYPEQLASVTVAAVAGKACPLD